MEIFNLFRFYQNCSDFLLKLSEIHVSWFKFGIMIEIYISHCFLGRFRFFALYSDFLKYPL